MSKNAQSSEMRAACCMLWVTMMTVTRFFNSVINSSIFKVAIGSRAEVGSSIKRTSGSMAGARDAQALLFATGEVGGRHLQAVLDAVPEGRGLERRLGRLIEDRLLLHAVETKTRDRGVV